MQISLWPAASPCQWQQARENNLQYHLWGASPAAVRPDPRQAPASCQLLHLPALRPRTPSWPPQWHPARNTRRATGGFQSQHAKGLGASKGGRLP